MSDKEGSYWSLALAWGVLADAFLGTRAALLFSSVDWDGMACFLGLQ